MNRWIALLVVVVLLVPSIVSAAPPSTTPQTPTIGGGAGSTTELEGAAGDSNPSMAGSQDLPPYPEMPGTLQEIGSPQAQQQAFEIANTQQDSQEEMQYAQQDSQEYQQVIQGCTTEQIQEALAGIQFAPAKGDSKLLIVGIVLTSAVLLALIVLIMITLMRKSGSPQPVPEDPLIQKLRSHVYYNLSKGFSPAQIRANLARYGWSEEQINQAFR